MAKVELEEPFFPASWKPSVLLELEFAGEAVKFGNFLSPAQAAVEPVVSFFHPIPALYTLILVDPDAFARAGAGDNSISPVNHWIQQGLKPPSVDEDPDPSKGLAVEKTTDALVPYIGPGPPPKTGDHRYTFLLYRETKEILPYVEQATLTSNDGLGRRNFDIARFVRDNGLELVGANYFISRNAEQ